MTEARVKLATLRDAALLRPRGYLEEVLAPPARIEGSWVIFPAHRYSALRERYSSARPSLPQAVFGLFREMVRWKERGFKIAPWRVFLARNKSCKACPYSVGGLIKTCGRCGCTRAKLFLASARCVEKRWPV